ncbi:uncharacterized protein LOC105888315 isoform X2 [Otolemur garnettii]|uniref:uncharacterized protein LOC105888315 isoform X2 n=1 Tax=Otolemur garnettii TaxID=30611 RepID=UPI000C7F64A3|nr:uncharacterized protein LOC105888315 isoform X2 [Otolemur garnettii]
MISEAGKHKEAEAKKPQLKNSTVINCINSCQLSLTVVPRFVLHIHVVYTARPSLPGIFLLNPRASSLTQDCEDQEAGFQAWAAPQWRKVLSPARGTSDGLIALLPQTVAVGTSSQDRRSPAFWAPSPSGICFWAVPGK